MTQRVTVTEGMALYTKLGLTKFSPDGKTIVVEGDFGVITVEDISSYVQVRYSGQRDYGSLYTYSDPTGTLEVGDLVEAPTLYDDDARATVVALGRREGFTGTPRAITAKFKRVPLA